jgi:hypothetical protein
LDMRRMRGPLDRVFRFLIPNDHFCASNAFHHFHAEPPLRPLRLSLISRAIGFPLTRKQLVRVRLGEQCLRRIEGSLIISMVRYRTNKSKMNKCEC